MNDLAPGLANSFNSIPEEQSYAIDRIDGEIPDFLRGSYFLNGPARFRHDSLHYRHWLDGDGFVCRLTFRNAGCDFAARFVRTQKLSAEEKAGRALFRTFGTAFESDQLVRGILLASPANVSVHAAAGTLLAFGEQGLPWELDIETLETLGEYDFGGRLNTISPFAAHPKFDPDTGEMWNFGISFSATTPRLNVYRFGSDGTLLKRTRQNIDYPCMVHDFALSRNYAVFHLSPFILDMGGLMQDGISLVDSLSWQPELGSTLLLIRRQDGSIAGSIPAGRGYCLHTINAFEEDDLLVFDAIEYAEPLYPHYQVLPRLYTNIPPGRPTRFRIDLKRMTLQGRERVTYDRAPDFPNIPASVLSRPYSSFWMLGISNCGRKGAKFFNQLLHCRWQTPGHQELFELPLGSYFGGEPVVVVDPAHPRQGVVICHVLDAVRMESRIQLFDFLGLEAGPVATIHLESPIHLGIHASFSSVFPAVPLMRKP